MALSPSYLIIDAEKVNYHTYYKLLEYEYYHGVFTQLRFKRALVNFAQESRVHL